MQESGKKNSWKTKTCMDRTGGSFGGSFMTAVSGSPGTYAKVAGGSGSELGR